MYIWEVRQPGFILRTYRHLNINLHTSHLIRFSECKQSEITKCHYFNEIITINLSTHNSSILRILCNKNRSAIKLLICAH